MRNRKWRVSALAIVTLAASLAGCRHTTTVTNLPTGVTQTQVQNWDSAVRDLNVMADSIHAASQLVQTLHNTTIVSNGATSVVLPSGKAFDTLTADLAKADQAEILAAEFLKTVPNNWGQSTQTQIASYISAVTAAIADATANGLAGITNSQSQAQVAQLLQAIASTAGLFQSL